MSKPTPEIRKTTERLRCQLTDEEKIEAGRELAETTNELEEIQDDKSQVVSEFKARTTAAEAKIALLGNKLRSGYEIRDVKCDIRFDWPKEGQKQTIRLDTNEVVYTHDMTEEEKQMQLPLDSDVGGVPNQAKPKLKLKKE